MTTTDRASAPLACVFGKAILARQAGCALATVTLAGEMERPCCASPVAHTNCQTLHALLRERARFALRLPPPATPLAHAPEMRIQCGGLRGLAVALGEPEGPPADIHRLVARSQEGPEGLLGVAFDKVVATMVRWEGRPRAAGGKAKT